MYNAEIRHLCNLQSDHPGKSCTHLTPNIVITIFFTIFRMLFFTSLWLFCNYQLYFLSPSPFSPVPLIPLPSVNCQNILWFSVFLLRLFILFFKIPHMSEIMWYLSFSVWPVSLSKIPCRSIYVVENGKISFSMWLSHVPFYICTTSLFIYLLMGT